MLCAAGVEPNKVQFVHASVIDIGRHGLSVTYHQLEQGFPIIGAGGQIVFDDYGEITNAGLGCDSRQFPPFVPRDSLTLWKIAIRAVPLQASGGPVFTKFAIESPTGGGPSHLLYQAVFQVTQKGRDHSWEVNVDAVTGEVLYSGDAERYVSRPTRAPTSEASPVTR